MSDSALFEPLRLPNGAVIPNRLAKAAMEENQADERQAPSTSLWRLYEAWAQGGVGLIISGNVMVDGRALTGPGGVVLEDEHQLPKFAQWAQRGRSNGAQFWLQINHPGRQVFADMGQPAWAPSAVAMDMGGLSKLFAQTQAMTEADIQDVIRRFARTAQLAEQAGFTGVEVHAAHGYLISQFLSPLTNKREDQWGGSLANRARLLLDVIKAVRAVVSPQFCVAVKLNSADFQRGGFDASDAKQVVSWLNDLPVDLVELSGGSYEAPAMQGQTMDGRTLAREAYFLEFAKDIAKSARMPVMVTGGILRKAVALAVRAGGVDMVGMGTALALNPSLVNEWRSGADTSPQLTKVTWKNKALRSLATMALIKRQMRLVGEGRLPKTNLSPLWSVLIDQVSKRSRTAQYRRWIQNR